MVDKRKMDPLGDTELPWLPVPCKSVYVNDKNEYGISKIPEGEIDCLITLV